MSPNCRNCGGFVSEAFARVFELDGTVPSCRSCAPYGEAGLPFKEIERRRGGHIAEGNAIADEGGQRPDGEHWRQRA